MNTKLFTDRQIIPFGVFRAELDALMQEGMLPLVWTSCVPGLVFALLWQPQSNAMQQYWVELPASLAYPSLTPAYPAYHMFERELYEAEGVTPEGHPWLKAVRGEHGNPGIGDGVYPYLHGDGIALHEVGVGPVHAGVIEPGHFRFICAGEEVLHLEIKLGYQHRGVRKLLESGDVRDKATLAESIAGDASVGHGVAYCQTVEALSGTQIDEDCLYLRSLALELERIGMHLADLSALAGDIAWLSGQSLFAAQRTVIINTSMALCGSRFGRGWFIPGGSLYGMSKEQNERITEALYQSQQQINLTAQAMFGDAGVLSRLDFTGILDECDARALGVIGLAGRASHIENDFRCAFPSRPYKSFVSQTQEKGDVFSRAYLRYLEINTSFELIKRWLSEHAELRASIQPIGKLQPNATVVSGVEGWRGGIIHLVSTGEWGETVCYKVYDPSFHNWQGLAHAVQGNGISDFPVCNKSFNLSYCGFDL